MPEIPDTIPFDDDLLLQRAQMTREERVTHGAVILYLCLSKLPSPEMLYTELTACMGSNGVAFFSQLMGDTWNLIEERKNQREEQDHA